MSTGDLVAAIAVSILAIIVGWIVNIACASMDIGRSSKSLRTTLAVSVWVPYATGIIVLGLFLYYAMNELLEDE